MKYLILFLFSFSVYASGGGDHHNDTVISNNYYSSESEYQSNGTALAMAVAAPQYDLNIDKWQFGIGGGYYEDPQGRSVFGGAFGMGKRTCFADNSSCGILNFSIGKEETGGKGGNIGFTFAF